MRVVSSLKKSRSSSFKSQRVDSATVAASLQLEEENRELIYSFIAVLMKLGFLSIGLASLLNLGFASHQRIRRNSELSSLVKSESKELEKLASRFDHLFTIGGRARFMEEQDQWITPNSIRIIWR